MIAKTLAPFPGVKPFAIMKKHDIRAEPGPSGSQQTGSI
jgi:hypothetical protein